MEYSSSRFESSEGMHTSLFQDDIYPTVESILHKTDDEAQFLKASCLFEYGSDSGATAEIFGELDESGQLSNFMMMCEYESSTPVGELDSFAKNALLNRLVDRAQSVDDEFEADMARRLYEDIATNEIDFDDVSYIEITVAEYVVDLKDETISKTFAVMSNLDDVSLDAVEASGLQDDDDELEDLFALGGGVNDDDIELIQSALARMR